MKREKKQPQHKLKLLPSRNPSNRIVKILTIFPPRILIDKNSNIDFNYSETLEKEKENEKKKNHLLKRSFY